MDDAKIPAPFKVEFLCHLPHNLARTALVVRPCVALLHTPPPKPPHPPPPRAAPRARGGGGPAPRRPPPGSGRDLCRSDGVIAAEIATWTVGGPPPGQASRRAPAAGVTGKMCGAANPDAAKAAVTA